MKYALDILSEDDFERLVVCICQDVLGIGVHSFSKGRDGGKDGYFSGTAQKYPSTKEPWSGNFILQAKHTTDTNASCSDNDFFANKTSVINKEIRRLKEIAIDTPFDCYLVFTNRKLSGGAHTEIKQYLQSELNIQNADIIGTEDLERYLDGAPKLAGQFNILKYALPDRFSKQDIRDVIILFSKQNESWLEDTDANGDKYNFSFHYIDKEKKNRLNNVSDEYFDDIKQHSLRFFKDIKDFLGDPCNRTYKAKYINTADDIRGFILKHSDNYTFMELLEEVVSRIKDEDEHSEIHQVRALVRVFVHYMYWSCDIGHVPSEN